MKRTSSRQPQDTLEKVLKAEFPIDPRRLTVLATLVLAMVQQRTVCLFQLVPTVSLLGTEETVYKRLKRFVQFKWSDQQTLIARFVLRHFQGDPELVLIMDRTNWKWGKSDVNILILSVMWKSFAFPLAWKVLSHSGNSNSATRIELVKSVLPLMQGKRLALLADREFIGQDWFRALKELGIKPTIRLRADSRVNGIEVWALFKKMQRGELRVWYRAETIYGVRTRVLACRNLQGQILYLAYHGWGEHAIRRYAWRWNCENMHQSMKSRGFRLEETHVTRAERISVLFGVMALAFIWCCLCGDFVATKSPTKVLAHGYPAKSLFRQGLDALQSVLSGTKHPKRAFRPTFPQLLAIFVP